MFVATSCIARCHQELFVSSDGFPFIVEPRRWVACESPACSVFLRSPSLTMPSPAAQSAFARWCANPRTCCVALRSRRAASRRLLSPLRTPILGASAISPTPPNARSFRAFGTLTSVKHGREGLPSQHEGLAVSDSPGILQLPGVHTPQDLLVLARRCIADCDVLLNYDPEGKTDNSVASNTTAFDGSPKRVQVAEDVRREVQRIDAVSNALCKVADAAEFLR